MKKHEKLHVSCIRYIGIYCVINIDKDNDALEYDYFVIRNTWNKKKKKYEITLECIQLYVTTYSVIYRTSNIYDTFTELSPLI